MSSRNADSIVVPASYDTEEVCTFKNRDSACFCSHELGVVSHYSGCMDDKIGSLDIFGSLTDENGYAHFSYSVEGLGLIIVRACELVSLRVEYLRERVHSRASDPDEMNVLFAF